MCISWSCNKLLRFLSTGMFLRMGISCQQSNQFCTRCHKFVGLRCNYGWVFSKRTEFTTLDGRLVKRKGFHAPKISCAMEIMPSVSRPGASSVSSQQVRSSPQTNKFLAKAPPSGKTSASKNTCQSNRPSLWQSPSLSASPTSRNVRGLSTLPTNLAPSRWKRQSIPHGVTWLIV